MHIVPFLTSVVSLTFVGTAHASSSHKAHEHGAGKLNLVVEGNKLTAELEVPSESIYGFEYTPKSEAEKTKQTAGGEKLKQNIHKMIILNPKLGCKFTNTKLELHAEEKEHDEKAGADSAKAAKKSEKHLSEHSETHAEFVAECTQPLAGSKVTFGFTKVFPRMHDLKVQVLSGDKQSGAEIEKDKGEVTL